VAGDGQFADRPRTVIVGHGVAALREFFGFERWPEEVVTFGLGGRALHVTGSIRAAPTSATCPSSSRASF
jgi:hypothetical protein